MNTKKQQIFLIADLILIILVSLFLILSFSRKSVFVDNQEKIERKTEENKLVENQEENKKGENKEVNKEPLGDANKNTITSLCGNLSELECFNTKLSGCVKADSIKDFLIVFWKTKIDNRYVPPEDQLIKMTTKINPPLEINFPNAEIYSYTHLLGGGDLTSYLFIKLGNTYCDLDQDNIKTVFSPIKTKEDALKYYFLTTRVPYLTYIMKESDYDAPQIKNTIKDIVERMGNNPLYNCGNDYRERLKNRVTEIKEISDGYLINFIVFNYVYLTYFAELKVQVNKDGTIKEISKEILLDCGGGAIL
jgi:hypothetical protein